PRVSDPHGRHFITIALSPLLRQLLEVDAGLELLEGDGEDHGGHLVPNHPVDARLQGLGAPDSETVSLPEQGREEGNALDVVPVCVREKDVARNWLAIISLEEPTAELANPRSSVEDDQPAFVGAKFDAGGISAVPNRAGPGARDGAASPPKSERQAHRPAITCESGRASPARRGWPPRCGGAR